MNDETISLQNTQQRPKVLVVDDIRSIFSLLNAVMREEYTLLYAASGEEALALAAAELPDLILLDIEMPGMNGYETCTRLRQNPDLSQLPVMFLTGHTNVKEEEWGLRLGAVDYIHKPFYPPLVELRVRNQLTLKQQRDQLEQLSRIDSLTGLTNRHAFNLGFEQAIRRAVESEESLAVLMIDIDHFKSYNDCHGHLAGDQCLALVAKQLQRCVDPERDLVARYGGEEFCALLPNSALERVRSVGEAMLNAVRDMPAPTLECSLLAPITISVGISIALVPGREERFALSLLDSADKALYQAKAEGRDRLAVSEFAND